MSIQELYSIFLQHPVITTDSRDCPAGSIFFALKGESFDGNAYAAGALEKGCSYAVIDNEELYESSSNPDSPLFTLHSSLIFVDDVLTALQQLAHEHRMALGTPVIGITGTNGKTTTKELIATVLQQKYNVLYTQGNFNNHIGVPKTLLQLRPEHELAVIEMGANHPGEIKTLVDIVEPDFGIITNVGKAHLEGFGSFEGVIRTKGELYDYLRTKADAKVFIDADNEHLAGIAHDLHLIKYSANGNAGAVVEGAVDCCAPFLNFTWSTADGASYSVKTQLIGAYNIYNMLAAATIGLHFGVTPEQICAALEGYKPSNNRSQLTVTDRNRLIVDTYNANPTSMAAALKNFSLMEVSPKMAILGAMRELGSVSAEEHQKVVDQLVAYGISDVWLVGDEFHAVTNCPFRIFHDVEEVKQAIATTQPQDKYILIKGSNSTKLFQLPELL